MPGTRLRYATCDLRDCVCRVEIPFYCSFALQGLSYYPFPSAQVGAFMSFEEEDELGADFSCVLAPLWYKPRRDGCEWLRGHER
jgi:hypothetical protein